MGGLEFSDNAPNTAKGNNDAEERAVEEAVKAEQILAGLNTIKTVVE